MKDVKCEIYNDHFQNFKRYNIPKAQLIIADIPYNLGKNAYASSTEWYIDGDNKKGESVKANSLFFDTDKDFRIAEYMHFCSKMLKKEPNHYIPLIFIKNYSSQVLKANMKIVGAVEYALILYRERLPKFNNDGKMIFNWMQWEKDKRPKVHPTQKPIPVLKKLIRLFTDMGDVVIDPVCGSGSTLVAAAEMNRNAYGFEIKKDFYKSAKEYMLNNIQMSFKV